MLAHYTKFYFDKYIKKNESIQAAATFLDVRTKNFSCFSIKDRKKYVKLAIETIKNICSNADDDIKKLVNSTTEPNKGVEKRKLGIYDFDNVKVNKPSNKTKSKTGLDKEIESYEIEPSKNIEPLRYWEQNE